jgi:hypothetical protein
MVSLRLLEVEVHEIQHVSPVDPEHSSCSAAASVEAEGRDACDDVAGAEEIRTTGIAEAGSSFERESQWMVVLCVLGPLLGILFWIVIPGLWRRWFP